MIWMIRNENNRQLQRQSDFDIGCLYLAGVSVGWDYGVDGVSELISGKDARLAWANDEEVEYYSNDLGEWFSLKDNVFLSDVFDKNKLRLKPRTIKINGVEVPSPFNPKEGDDFYYIDGAHTEGYSWRKMHDDTPDWFFENPVWRTEEEIKQVVAALRSVFNES